MARTRKVKAPWCSFSRLSDAALRDAYMYCEPHMKESCINTKIEKAMAQYLGREIRKPMTQNGFFSWSEQIDGEWRRFRVPLSLEYASKIDHYDRTGKKFKPPAAYPYGPTEEITIYDRVDTRDERAIAQRKYVARIAAGEIKPRETLRRPQAPIVARRQQKHVALVEHKRANRAAA
jgi:hypothetical protein